MAGLLALVVAWGWASVGLAQSPVEPGIGPSSEAAPQFSAADNVWVLVSSALVLFMTVPALALFYSGLVRRKNVLSVMMQCVFLMCVMTILWALYGYSLVFGGNGPWIGDTRYMLMQGVDAHWGVHGPELALFPGLTIPILTHMLFQGMFFIITPALICGAFAERMKFSTMVVFLALWGTFVYCPLAHWLWGGGVLAYGSAACQEVLGRRGVGFCRRDGSPHQFRRLGVGVRLGLGETVGLRKGADAAAQPDLHRPGAGMLWVGWFGFNAGSALSAGQLAASAFGATHFAAAAGGVTWAALEWKVRGKPSILGACSGLVAGLACITQAAGYVTLMPALIIGAIGSGVCYLMCTRVKNYFGYDDSLDVFGVHGVAGTLGALLTGVFARGRPGPP